jgi:dTDP-4-dehydrorhamnose reductase
MLGSAMFRFFSEKDTHEVWGTVRSKESLGFFNKASHSHIINDIDVLDYHALATLFDKIKPDYVINCIGLVKQLADADDPLITLPINSLLPHHLAKLCTLNGAKLLQISTDCVFSGNKGNYVEEDISDATDLYGKSKFIGEVSFPNTLTIRTSIIGHELQSQHSLIDWFLAQQGSCMGFTKAIFSGFPTIVLAEIIHDYIINNSELSGVYHVAALPISKFDLLNLVAETYDKSIEIIKNEKIAIDRSLNAAKFNQATGYQPPSWPTLIQKMHTYYTNLRSQHV